MPKVTTKSGTNSGTRLNSTEAGSLPLQSMSLGLLPFDLLAPILACLEGTRPPALRICCLVSHDFNQVASMLLYRRITIYSWYL